MNIDISTIDALVKVVQFLVLSLAAFATRTLISIRRELSGIRILIVALETWRLAHEKLDDERVELLRASLHDLARPPS